jgi:hypothetical protein
MNGDPKVSANLPRISVPQSGTWMTAAGSANLSRAALRDLGICRFIYDKRSPPPVIRLL